MKRFAIASFAAVLLAPAIAAAQPGYPPTGYPPGGGYYAGPPTLPGGFHDRMGRLALGFSIGLGAMSTNDGSVPCSGCNYNPAAFEVDFHVGGLITPRLALMLEVQGNGQTVESVDGGAGTVTLVQGTAMAAGQYWLTPKLWIKGGIGAAHLSYDYNDAYQTQSQPIANGAAVMGGIGYEVYSTREFSVDLQGRIIEGSYKGINNQISSGSVGVGFNWY
jgi:opacity protein-like surface antigen